MKNTTLKKLIEDEFERCETISQFKHKVFALIDAYSEDNSEPNAKYMIVQVVNPRINDNPHLFQDVFMPVEKEIQSLHEAVAIRSNYSQPEWYIVVPYYE